MRAFRHLSTYDVCKNLSCSINIGRICQEFELCAQSALFVFFVLLFRFKKMKLQ